MFTIKSNKSLQVKESEIGRLEESNSKNEEKISDLIKELSSYKGSIEIYNKTTHNKESEIGRLEEANRKNQEKILKSDEQNLDFYQKLLKCKKIIDENNNIINKNNNDISTLKKINETNTIRILELEKEKHKYNYVSKIVHEEIINSEYDLKIQNLEKNPIIDRIEKNLNDKQLEAVTTTEGFIRIIAGAGSGKTKALTSRYAYIIEALGISPSNILCVTFTNKAAQEMRNRVKYLVGEGKDTSYISTYHGFCVKVLREDINKILFPKDFIIMDIEDQKIIIREIYNDLSINTLYIFF